MNGQVFVRTRFVISVVVLFVLKLLQGLLFELDNLLAGILLFFVN